MFTNPKCGPCEFLLPTIARWQNEHSEDLTIALVSEGAVIDNRDMGARHGIAPVLVQQAREVAEAYKAYGTPAAVLIGTDHRIASPLATGAEAIEALVNRTVRTSASDAAPSIPTIRGAAAPEGATGSVDPVRRGRTAPTFVLPDLHGRLTTLSEIRGKETLLLFWNPGCGYCRAMLQALKFWEDSPPPDPPVLLLVSTGTADENLQMGLRSRIVLDPAFHLGSVFGAMGTPTAVLLDADGIVASEVATGADAVMRLARADVALGTSAAGLRS